MQSLVRRYGFAAAIALALALMALAVVGKAVFGLFGGEQAQAAQGNARRAALVAVTTVDQHEFADVIQAIGAAEAKESIVITPKAADTIRSLRFESGDRVRRGQVLVEMASVEQDADLTEARAQAQVTQEDFRRTQTLFDRGFVSQARLDQAQAAAAAAQARVTGGASRVADRTIRAPFSGVVGLRQSSPGEYVQPGDPIGTLDDISEIKVDFDVSETEMAHLALGAPITARTSAYADQVFQGHISQIDSRVAAATRTIRVRAVLPNTGGRLRPGMLLSVELRSDARQGVGVPEAAVVDEIDGVFVFRIANEDGGPKAERVRVETGARTDGMIEIASGLNAGDRIVIEGLQSLRDGQTVRLTESNQQSASPPGQQAVRGRQ
jgi:membrane fusion protein (multidrug efflux system)